MPTLPRNTRNITFSLILETPQHILPLIKGEDCIMSKLLQEAIRLYMEEWEWCKRERLECLRSRRAEQREERA